MTQNLRYFFLGLPISLVAFAACQDLTGDCKYMRSCKDDALAGSSSGGDGSGGSSRGGNGKGGAAKGGTSSTGGTTTKVPCNGTCSGTTPVCDTNTDKCVACLASTDCKDSSKSVCAPSNVCVECTQSTDCKDATKPVCNPASNACVGCLANTDCKTATAARCDTGTNTCTPCQSDNDCTQITGKGVCNAGACVQCTGKKYTACGQLEGKALVCDSAAQTCTSDKKAGSSGLCQPCVSDAQCPAGQLCHQQMFDGKPVGYFCFWKQGDTANGAPAACFTNTNRPYVKVDAGVQSIDGETATLCTLAVTTCPALNGFRSTDCAPSGTPSDTLCGFAPGVDSKCVETTSGSGTFRCTTTCGSNDDCLSGFTCNTGVTPRVCTFQ
ncbi:MAG: hypothetical protein QM784_40290 [Polyangiaceae bacterium]